MASTCRLCGGTLNAVTSQCEECGAVSDTDEFGTIAPADTPVKAPPPRPRGGPSPPPPTDDWEAPAPKPAPAPQPPPRPVPVTPPPRPVPQDVAPPPAPEPVPPPAAPGAKSWLKRQFQASPAPPRSAPSAPPAPAEVVAPEDVFLPPERPAEPAPRPPIAPQAAVRPRPAPMADDDEKTIGVMGGLDIHKVKVAEASYTLQFLRSDGEWHEWGTLPPTGRTVGRSSESSKVGGLNTMAPKHMKFGYRRSDLYVEDNGSLNGVYVRIKPQAPARLDEGARFRVGNHIFEYHEAEPQSSIESLTSPQGEVFRGREVAPLGWLVAVREDGTLGTAIPLTREETILGRKDSKDRVVTVLLAGDPFVSKSHARVVRHQGATYLEDLGSSSGTYMKTNGPHRLVSGDEVLAGDVRFRVVTTK